MSNVTNERVLRHDPAGAAQAGRGEPQEQAEATKRQASEAAASVKAQGAELKQAVTQEASRASEEARQSAVEAGQRLRSEGVAIFARQKNAAAQELTHLRDALHAASEKLNEEDDRRIADITQVAADRLDAVADYLRNRDLNRLASDVATVARRRPALFYGGLFVAGLSASRFLKASASHRAGT